ncbi:DUF349 domain-containing protein [Marivirga sp. S37H4]|uniref:DUF349 domain-containing protein n=1 Tax=Marivirga aurantiaca TaxID=2802615 RepID=A0A934WXK0_9BACT|nr:DUF349 domain-containing protein [Marivirga aurantiaca]MBK6264989.1 DUF349 domain-containing protein [Marivirga aurantiaca]
MTELKQDMAFIEEGKVILKAQGEFPERVIGEVKDSETESIQFFENKFTLLINKVDEVQKQIEEEDNKGSFLMKIVNLKKSLSTYDGIGDFLMLKDRLVMLEKLLEDYISQNRKRNLEVKSTLIEEAKSYASNPNWREATEQLKELRQRWIRVGAVDDSSKEEIESNFQAVYDEFYERKKAFHEAKQAMMAKRIEQYEQLIEKARKLKTTEKDSEKLSPLLGQLVEEWKSLENIPKENYSQLLNVFKKLTHIPGQIERKKQNASPKKQEIGVEKKKELLKQLELAKELPIEEAVVKAKEIQQSWKELGKVSVGKKGNEDFFFWNDYIFEKHFLDNLFKKKAKPKLDNKEALKFKMNLLRDLLSRDQKELLIFEENLEKFNLGTDKLDKMVGFKHEKQKRKIAVKQQILDELRDSNKNQQ